MLDSESRFTAGAGHGLISALAAWISFEAVALIVFVCWAANIGNAGRLAAVTVTLIVLIPRDEPVWRIALFRFLEVSWGIAIAVMLVMLMSRFAKRPPSSTT
jgi:hypothetical protein